MSTTTYARTTPASTPTRYLTPVEVAARLGCSAGHLANQRSAGVGLAYYKFGSRVRYALSDVEDYERHARVATLPTRATGGSAPV